MLELITQSIQTKKRTKMKKYLLFMVLVCLLGNRALAQSTTETIDFSGWNYDSSGPHATLTWSGNSISSITSTDNLGLTRSYTNRFTVDNINNWRLWGGFENKTYLQLNIGAGVTEGTVYIHNLNEGDHVTVVKRGHCTIMSSNTQSYGNNNTAGTQYNGEELTITANGTVELKFYTDWDRDPGIRSITIQEGQGQGQQQDPDPIVQKDPFFNYDPGYEVYDFFEVRDVILERNSDGQITNGPTDNTAHTNYSVSNAGFDLNGNSAQYFTYNNNDLTLNNRIAISQSGRWRFTRGLIVPSGVDAAFFSICNLKKGDRVQIFYTGDDPVFASQADGTYNGCSAFYDRWNDGDFNSEDGDHYITQGGSVEFIASLDRNEGTLARDEQVRPTTLHTSSVYVITEDGHMDFRLNNTNPLTRIVKVYIWSDHQATMIDDYSERDYQYTSHFDITGELQAKEHIVPGGLEVRIGNEDKTQHAIVVASKEGPVSYVNAVDGFKLPGVTGSVQNGIQINFNLGSNNQQNIPTTGTFYKFMPLESGTMKVRFTAYSMYYYRYDINGNAIYYDEGGTDSNGRNHSAWKEEYGRANEQTVDRPCPYYIKVSSDNGESFSDATGVQWTGGSPNLANGGEGEFILEVEAGKIYYLFGGWTSGANGDNTNLNNFDFMFIRNINDNKITPHACGVAELFDVAFTPSKQIYPLAKWVPSGTTYDNNLATIVGYHDTELTVKKMSGNITGCEPYIDGGKLKIKNITFKDGENPGGVILIKFGTNVGGTINYYKVDPVYVFTVAYDANYHSTPDVPEAQRGHTWDFTASSLNGLDWNPSTGVPTRTKDINNDNINDVFENITSQNYAQAEPFGTYFNNFFTNGETEPVTSSFLYKEMNYVDNGVNRSDWMFNYRLQKNGEKYDPRFLNKYDMEGDNADMIWDTEGIIIEANSNMSCIFNEFGNGDIHASTKDPDRYVGILPGGSFLIPHLNKDDRVIIYMGSGVDTDELETEDMRFHITNARDAEYKVIDPEDVYLAGGSLWKGKEGDNNYRGCYHFFAKADGDMKFTLEGSNSICKIYKIQIYRGDRINTNEIMGETENDKYLLWSRAADPNDANDEAAMGSTYNWTLKYFGKNQKLANGTNDVNNDIVAWTGTGISTKTLTTSAETDPTEATYNTFTFEHDYNTIGTFRARGKDMEKNMKYLADYAEHNVTVAHQQTMQYPYTWDIMDMTGWSNNADRFNNDVAYGDYPYTQKPDWFDSVTDWDKSYEKSSRDLSLFGNAVNNENGYVLRLNTQKSSANYPQDNIFESAQDIDGNQLWADGQIVPESQGLWFHTPNQNTLNGSMRIYDDGMSVGGNPNWRYNMVVPNVPAGAAVYMRIRVAEDYCEHKYKFAGSDTSSDLTLLPTDKDNEYIVAIKNDKGAKKHLTLSFVGYTLLKLAVSEDPKTVNIKGYASESHKRVIDHTLTSFFTGKPIYAYTAENYNESESKIDLVKITKPMPAATADGQTVGSVLYNSEAEQEGNTDARISILDGGFHLFVPDMHDYTGNPNDAENMKTAELQSTSNNMMKSYNAGGTSNTTIAQKGDDGVRYVLSYQYFEHDKDGQTLNTAQEEAFYRVAKGGAAIKPNSAYIAFSSTSLAKVSFLFEDELFGPSQGITTGITETPQQNVKAEWYSLDGRKLNGAPTEKGLYIINGKKVLVK